MQKILFLIPPSEWKSSVNFFDDVSISHNLELPYDIAKNASEKDLKCKWVKYEQSSKLNENLKNAQTNYAINRYNWVMFKYIDYHNLDIDSQKFFNTHFKILSWFYMILNPLDKIWNYKLPIETKWLLDFWQDSLVNVLNNSNYDIIVDFLPDSYKKVINFKSLKQKIFQINFVQNENGKTKKISHWVKKLKWEFINKICLDKSLDIDKYFVWSNWSIDIYNILV